MVKQVSVIFLASTIFVFFLANTKCGRSSLTPDYCDCAFNALQVNTIEYDSSFNEICDRYLHKLTDMEKSKRIIESLECPLVKIELESKEKEAARKNAELDILEKCNQLAASDFVKQSIRNIGAVILDGPVLAESDNRDCYYVFTVIAQKGFSVEVC